MSKICISGRREYNNFKTDQKSLAWHGSTTDILILNCAMVSFFDELLIDWRNFCKKKRDLDCEDPLICFSLFIVTLLLSFGYLVLRKWYCFDMEKVHTLLHVLY
jgi:hypothetical protein